MENADFEEEPIEMPILMQCRHGHESMKMFFCLLSMVDVCLYRFGIDFAVTGHPTGHSFFQEIALEVSKRRRGMRFFTAGRPRWASELPPSTSISLGELGQRPGTGRDLHRSCSRTLADVG